jgi:hypothetical protein
MEELLEIIINEVIDDTSKVKADTTLGHYDNCIPVSVFTSKLLNLYGVESYPIEACALIYPDSSKNDFHLIGNINLNSYTTYGHMVTYIPNKNIIIDFSLCYQRGVINEALNDMISSAGQRTDAIYYFPSSVNKLIRVGTGSIKWHVFPDALGWKETGWDIEKIEKYAQDRFRQRKS